VGLRRLGRLRPFRRNESLRCNVGRALGVGGWRRELGADLHRLGGHDRRGRSPDAAWRREAQLPVDGCIALAIAGANIWLANNEGVQRSVDGGASWSPTSLDQQTRSLAVDPAGGTVYAVTNAGAYKSIDAGETWRGISPSNRVEALALDPLGPSRIWLAACDGAEGGPLHFSVNSGETWSSPPVFPALATFGCASAVQFGTSGALYVLGADLYVSRDGGTTWTTSSSSGIARFSRESLAISPDERTFFVATDRGLFRSSSASPISAF
jgi:hypothetical protein